jgi:hypothetical protein
MVHVDLEEREIEKDEAWVDEKEVKVSKPGQHIPIEKKMKILKLIAENPGWSLRTIQKKGGAAFRAWNYKKKWEEQVRRGGTLPEKYKKIDTFVKERFVESRRKYKMIRGTQLRRWALQRAAEFTKQKQPLPFKAGESWLTKFKRRHRISSRKITHHVNRRQVNNPSEIISSAKLFQEDIKNLSLGYKKKYILNTDQCGFQYELLSSRSLSHKGEKLTLGFADLLGKNKASHSYTVQYTINSSGEIVGNVFVCLREAAGRLGDSVKKNLFQAPNVTLTCSKSGKLSKSIVEYYLDNIVVKYIRSEGDCDKFMFLVDSWRGHTDPNLYNTERFGSTTDGIPKCELKIIPEKCTALCQPLDTTFHRQLKYMAREICTYAALRDEMDPGTRDNIIRLQSLLHHQLAAPIFRKMIKYSWYSAGLSDDKPSFTTVKTVCFNLEGKSCECKKSVQCEDAFIQCSRCRRYLCFSCFFWDYHVMSCTQNQNKEPFLTNSD